MPPSVLGLVQKPRPLFLIAVSVAMGIMLLTQYLSTDIPFPGPIRQQPPSSVDLDLHSLSTRHHDRLLTLRQKCQELRHVTRLPYYETPDMNQIFTNIPYNFSVCTVPKAGSSFLKQIMFYLSDIKTLQRGAQMRKLGFSKEERLEYVRLKQQNIFNLSRYEIHSSIDYSPIRISVDEFKDQQAFKVILARNPYTRLFSAYIDKFFVPIYWKVHLTWYVHKMMDQGMDPRVVNGCDAKFEGFELFLENIVMYAEHAYTNIHWAPISTLCDTCGVEPDMVIKQETYTDDIEYLMYRRNVKQLDVISEQIGQKGVQSKTAIKGLIRTLFLKGSRQTKKCFSPIQVAERVWEALKIQGQVYEYIDFPRKLLEVESMLTTEHVVETFLGEMEKMPISARDSEFQRQHALIRAYRNIRPGIIAEIQALYYLDFMTFQYDLMPPTFETLTET